MDIIRKVKELNFPEGGYVVTGSGAMDTLGIREAKDIDLVVSPKVYEKLKSEGWEEKFHDDGRTTLEKDIYEVMLTWDDINNKANLPDLLEDARIADGVPFVNVKRLMEWKKRKGREKDLRDVELIQKHLESQT